MPDRRSNFGYEDLLACGRLERIAIIGAIKLRQDLALLDELSLFGIHARHAPADLESRLRCDVGFHRTARGD